MKVIVRVPSLTDIGPLDHAIRLPMGGRKAIHLVSKCAACGKDITDEHFICGFKEGHPNMMLHERCIDEHTRGLLDGGGE